MSKGKPYQQQQPKRFGQKAIRILGTVTVALVVIGLWANVQGDFGEPESLEDFMRLVERRGGELVQCQQQKCYGLRTGQYVGEGYDGLYLSYAPGTISDVELRRQAELLKQLLNRASDRHI